MSTKNIPSTSLENKESGSIPVTEKKNILKNSFVEKELLNASVIQKELMTTIRELNVQIGTLNATLNLIQEHEFVEFHKSKWRIIAYQLALGILFAIGTVMGLVLISWATYTFFKDSEILMQIVEKQLSSRNFNLSEIRERATKDAGKGVENTKTVAPVLPDVATGSSTKTEAPIKKPTSIPKSTAT